MLEKGEVIHDVYRIEGMLGEGGISEIYLAYHLRLKQPVVLKSVKDKFSNLSEDKKRLDADILKNLRHSGLPQVYDIFEENGSTYTVIDYIKGKNLKQVIDERKSVSRKEIIRWGIEICEALNVLHSQKKPIIHCDIKPENIMLDDDGQIVLIDFNISMMFGGDGRVLGLTPGYAPPEQYETAAANAPESSDTTYTYATVLEPEKATGNLPSGVDVRSDIYGVGATLLFLMTGKVPPKSTERENKPHDIFGETDSSTIDGLKLVIEKAMAVSPRRRYSDITKMADDLRNTVMLDPKVKRLQFRREAISIACLVSMAVFLCTGVYGYLLMKNTSVEVFNMYIGNSQIALSEAEYEVALQNADGALELYPTNPVAVLQYAAALSRAGSIDESLGFLTERIPRINQRADSEALAELYYFTGNLYFENEDYFNAAANFRKAIEKNGVDPHYHRDLIISLAHSGNIDEAKTVAEAARQQNIESASLTLANAEISYFTGDYQQAELYFLDIINEQPISELFFRSVVGLGTMYMNPASGIENRLDKAIDMLEDALPQLDSTGQRVIVREILGAAYVDAAVRAEKSDAQLNRQFIEKALDCFAFIDEWGYTNLYSGLTSARLYQYVNDYEKSRETIDKLISRYPNDYRPYMRMAYLLIEIENAKESEVADYSDVIEYFYLAEQRYRSGDREMTMLKEMVNRLEEDQRASRVIRRG